MKNIKIIFLFLALTLANVSIAEDSGERKLGILLVAFGTSHTEAQRAYDNIEKKVKGAFPEIEIRWAFTSNFIRKKLREKGTEIDSPAEALSHMASDGYTHIVVQSVHIFPGQEYENLKKTIAAFNEMPKNAKVTLLGHPMLFDDADFVTLANKVSSIFPKERKEGEAVLMMGHGTHHPSDIYYSALQYHLWQKSPLDFVATVEGHPTFEDAITKLKRQKVKTVWLMPFMTVAGDHAKNDMAGPDKDSWKSQLEKEGFNVKIVMKGLAEYDEIAKIWVEHLKETVHELDN